jgi:hypothetical protein
VPIAAVNRMENLLRWLRDVGFMLVFILVTNGMDFY